MTHIAFRDMEDVVFLEVIHQISKLQGVKNRRFGYDMNKITKSVTAIKSLRFALFTRGYVSIYPKIRFQIFVFLVLKGHFYQ